MKTENCFIPENVSIPVFDLNTTLRKEMKIDNTIIARACASTEFG